MVQSAKSIILNKQEAITKSWLEQISESVPESVAKVTSEKTAKANNEAFINLIFNYMSHDANSVELNEYIEHILHFGYPLSFLTRGLQLFRRVAVNTTIEDVTDTKSLLKLYQDLDSLIDPIFNKLIEEATTSWEHTVTIQKNALMELSAPLSPVMEHISVMPLIGTIDTERAKLIMENLLNGVIEHRSEVVLIDITGVPVVDTMVAHHIIQAAEAVRLVGADCILVGIRPEIAQTIINLGIGLGEFPTKSTLQKGIEAALAITNRKIINTGQEG